jgi:hypothetical protein
MGERFLTRGCPVQIPACLPFFHAVRMSKIIYTLRASAGNDALLKWWINKNYGK